eukprot:6202516-Pleurochrysis_carterae.AAC.1
MAIDAACDTKLCLPKAFPLCIIICQLCTRSMLLASSASAWSGVRSKSLARVTPEDGLSFAVLNSKLCLTMFVAHGSIGQYLPNGKMCKTASSTRPFSSAGPATRHESKKRAALTSIPQMNTIEAPPQVTASSAEIHP